MASKRPTYSTKQGKARNELHRCGDCANCTEVWEPHNLLSLKGEPTLGRCPYWKESRSVLLSWLSNCIHFKPKTKEQLCPQTTSNSAKEATASTRTSASVTSEDAQCQNKSDVHTAG